MALCNFGVINVRVAQAVANPSLVGAAVVQGRHALQVHHFLVIATVVVHDHEQWNFVMRGGPQCPWCVQQVAIGLKSHSHSAERFVGQCGAHRRRQSIAHTLSA